MTSSNGNGGGGAAPRDPDLDRTRLRTVHAALTSGDIATAGKLAEDALNDGIDHPMVLNLVAGRREEEGRLEEALALLQRALAAAPEAIGVMNAVGLCLSRMGRQDEAIAAFGAALARTPEFAPALANRGTALAALGRAAEARLDFEAAAAIDPGNLVAANGLAALALGRGELAEARRLAEIVLVREPGYPAAVATMAGADLAGDDPAAAAARLAALLDDPRPTPADRAAAWALRGDALEALGRFADAFSAWTEANRLRQADYAPDQESRPGTLALVRDLTAVLAGRRVATAWGHGGRSPAKGHVFLVGFPRAGAELPASALASQPDVALLAETECLIDATREWLADPARLASFCEAEDDALEPWRDAYWRRVAEAGVDPRGRLFVDAHPFNSFKLPLIARLFPEARVLVARRDPRDNVLACFRHGFRMSDPAWQMLTLAGTADLYAATMALVEASEDAFGLFVHPVQLEALRADFGGEMRTVCEFVGLPRREAMRDIAGGAPAAEGVGRWHDYAPQLEPVMAVLAPWVAKFGLS